MRLLDFESWTIPLGASILDVANTFKSALTAAGWQLLPGGDGTAMQWNLIQATANISNPAYAFNFDNDLSSASSSYNSAPYCLGLTFDAAKVVSRFRIIVGSDNYFPLTWDLQWSDDAGNSPTNWTTQQSYTMPLTSWRPRYQHFFDVATPGAHRHWRIKVNTVNGGYCTIAELTFYDANGNPSNKSDQCFLDFIPPDSETIGNVNGFEFIRMRFNANSIKYSLVQKYLVDYPQCFTIAAASGSGINSNSVTINGAQCAQDAGTLAAGNSVFDNLYYLYLALRASNNANISAYKYEYVSSAALNGNESSIIRATKKAYTATKDTVSAINCTYSGNGDPIPAGWITDINGHYDQYYGSAAVTNGCGLELTTDLVNGFVYYLSIYNRGFSLGIKTNVGYYGPITVEWADNAKANAALPLPLNRYCTPVELFVIGSGNAPGIGGGAYDANRIRTAHLLAIADQHGARQRLECDFYNVLLHPQQKNRFRGLVYDTAVWSQQGLYDNLLSSSGVWSGQAGNIVEDDFQIHRLTMTGSWVVSVNEGSAILPAVPLECHFMVAGTINNEQLLLVSDITVAGTIVSDMDGTTALDTLTLSDASSLASSGFVIIDANGISEIVQYTGKNGNQLTGCTRNKYSSLRRPHYAGDEVRQGLWFVKINNAALFCGYNRPS